jgi:hypothetical protein
LLSLTSKMGFANKNSFKSTVSCSVAERTPLRATYDAASPKKVRIQILRLNNSEKSEVKHLKENKMYVFSIAKLYCLFYRFRNTYERNESHFLENCHAKILVLES